MIGAPLTVLVLRKKAMAGFVFASLGIVQTISVNRAFRCVDRAYDKIERRAAASCASLGSMEPARRLRSLP